MNLKYDVNFYFRRKRYFNVLGLLFLINPKLARAV